MGLGKAAKQARNRKQKIKDRARAKMLEAVEKLPDEGKWDFKDKIGNPIAGGVKLSKSEWEQLLKS